MLKSNYCISITRVYRWEASQFGGRVNSESSSVNTADIKELLNRNKQKKKWVTDWCGEPFEVAPVRKQQSYCQCSVMFCIKDEFNEGLTHHFSQYY